MAREASVGCPRDLGGPGRGGRPMCARAGLAEGAADAQAGARVGTDERAAGAPGQRWLGQWGGLGLSATQADGGHTVGTRPVSPTRFSSPV